MLHEEEPNFHDFPTGRNDYFHDILLSDKKNNYLAGQQLAIKVEWLMEPRHTAHI